MDELPRFLMTVAMLIGVVGVIIKSLSVVHLDKKFSELGRLAGKTRQEIVDVAGTPNVITQLGDNTTIQEWNSPRYGISLKFIGETCVGVVQERKA